MTIENTNSSLHVTISNTNGNILDYDAKTSSPTATVHADIDTTSAARLWLHCEVTETDGTKKFFKLAEAAPIDITTEVQPTFEIPSDELAKLADDTELTFILTVSADGSRDRQSISNARNTVVLRRRASVFNASRWMTDIGPDLECLKLHDVVMPMAHNAGVDQDGAGWPADQWAACQNHTFNHQLAHGIRALDLRLHWKGSRLMFQHGGYDAGRQLYQCIAQVADFVTRNPGEIVILNFHELTVDEWDFNRAFRGYTHLCIPSSARNMTIGQIRRRFPGRSIIVARNNPPDYCWPKINSSWTGNDLNDQFQLRDHINKEMATFPKGRLYPIFACGYSWLGPVRYNSNAAFWSAFFNKLGTGNYRQASVGNIIYCDFFEATGVVNRCIHSTRARASKASQSTAQQLKGTIVSSNSIKLDWVRPRDSEAVTYSLYANDRLVARQAGTEYVFSGLADGASHTLQVLPHYASGDGAPAEIRVSLGDVTKPSKPTDLRFFILEGYGWLFWKAATDNVGVKEYQIYRDGKKINTVEGKTSTVVNPADKGFYSVRAVDSAGNFAESDAQEMPSDITAAEPADLRQLALIAEAVTQE
ncbi:hypothetical protein ACIQVE_17375 [Pseudomonas sp. NPDC098747]|uniref:hypothetical protein n=1 Tax=Pseudomonas sp. NPDC098747 TaxID=3364487 RepID=UPI00383A0605